MSEKKVKPQDNVIQFPKAVSKGVQAPPKPVGEPAGKKKERKRKSTIVGAALVCVASLATSANLYLHHAEKMAGAIVLNSTSGSGGRSIASVEPVVVASRPTAWEHELADRLLEEKSNFRSPASLGHKPTVADRFRYGPLEGKYAIRYHEGKLQEVSFAKSLQGQTSPSYLRDPQGFLRQHKELLPKPYERMESVSRVVTENGVREHYRLISASQAEVGMVTIETDTYGRLLSLKVSEQSTL